MDGKTIPTRADRDINPALAHVLSLPTCPDAGDWAPWAGAALAPYGWIPDARVVPLGLRQVITDVPILRELPSATCIAGFAQGNVTGWLARDRDGITVACAAGIAHATTTVPARMTAEGHHYHQEHIASGQPINGFIKGDRMEAMLRQRLVVLELKGAGVDSWAAGVAWESLLFFADLEPLDGGEAFALPTFLPSGLRRCTAPMWFQGPDRRSTVTEYGDGHGRWLRVTTFPTTPDTDGVQVQVAGRSATLEESAGRRRLTIPVIPAFGQGVQVEATDDIAAADLVTVVASIPALDRHVLQPRAGSGDLRDAFGEDWLRSLLESIGADVTNMSPLRAPDGSSTLTAALSFADGCRFTGIFAPQIPRAAPSINMTGMLSVEGVDLYVSERQAYGWCSNVFLNIVEADSPSRARSAADVAVSLIRALVG
jgi:hypothetical protein